MDELEELIALARRGLGARLVSAVLAAALVAPFVGVAPAVIWVALVTAFELGFQYGMAPIVGRMYPRHPVLAERINTAGTVVGALFYVCAPVFCWFNGGDVGRVLAICWLCGTMIHGFSYYTRSKAHLIAAIGPATLAMLVLPILSFGWTWAGVVMAIIMMQLVAVAAVGANDLERLRIAVGEKDRARRAAEEANMAKSQFLATMSHELRTPLNAVIGFSEILEEDITNGTPPSAEDARRIQAAARHLLGLISDVLDMSKIEAGRLELHQEETDLVQLVNDIGSTLERAAAANGNAIDVICEPGLGSAIVDPTKLRQCLLNLASNACKFTENGAILIAARRDADSIGPRLVFTVSDTGAGIAPDQAARLFKPFVQVDSSSKRRHGGTGLGLAITRELARLMGGDVELASTLGRGSVFTLWLRPAQVEPTETRQAA